VVQFGHHLKETVLYPQDPTQILSLRPHTSGQAQSVCPNKPEEIIHSYSWQENRHTGSGSCHTGKRGTRLRDPDPSEWIVPYDEGWSNYEELVFER